MVDPAIGLNAYVEEVRRQRGLLGNDAAQMAADLAVARAENVQLRARGAELVKLVPPPAAEPEVQP